VFELLGGDVKVAVGASYRRETFDANFHQGPTNAPTTLNTAAASRTVKFGYAEVFVPIFGSANAISGLRALDGKVVTLGGSPITNILVGVDPAVPFYNAVVLAGGNPGLKPERAKTYSFGIDFQPTFLERLRASLTYYNVEYVDRITVPPFGSSAVFTDPAYAQYIYHNASPALIAALGAGLPPVVLLPSNPAFPTTLLDLRRQNLSVSKTRGIDFDFSYHWSLSAGSMIVGVAGQRVLKFDNQGTVNSPAADQLQLGKPKWLARARLGWKSRALDTTAFVNYSGAYENQLSTGGVLQTYSASAYATIDLHVGYRLPDQGWTRGTQLSADVEDLFDKNPPMTLAGPRRDVNVIGRTAWLGLRKSWAADTRE
jgi:iron complex outermembrane receptor protein